MSTSGSTIRRRQSSWPVENADEHLRADDNTGERRWRAIGLVEGVILLLVAHTVREEGQDEVIRLISARCADRKERKRYDQIRAQDLG